MNKKLVIGLLFMAGIAGAACMGPFCWDDRGAYINGLLRDGTGEGMVSLTAATMNTTTPSGTGMRIYCSDCTTSRVCVSSGTTKGAYVVDSASGSFAGSSYPHCS